MKPIDYFLNRITMYRLVLYYLSLLLIFAGVLGYFKILPFGPMALFFSTVCILLICWLTNQFFSYMFEAPVNIESVYITGLILALIISPIQSLSDFSFFTIVIWASVWAIASKYIFAINKKHIFNPAAFGVAVTALFLGLSATWWVGTLFMAPLVAVGGLLIVKKIRRFDLFLSFFITAVIMILGYEISRGVDILSPDSMVIFVQKIILGTPILFFSFVMFTEPLTTPPTRIYRTIYGIFTGILYAPFIYFFGIFSTPELALLVGNIFSYIVSPKYKMILGLKRREKVANDTYDFVFEKQKINFKPGQYMEWILPHEGSDNRGMRRFFTIASSPTEDEIRIGIKFYPKPSSFKTNLFEMKSTDKIVASGLSGDFTMPKNKNKKLVFIAGGIGVTPFRSMIKYLTDKNESRDIVLFYSNKEFSDIAYSDLFFEAKGVGVKTVYTLTDIEKVPKNWIGEVGYLDAEKIKKEIPDYLDRIFYISGPQSLVLGFEETLEKLGVSKANIKVDYFPGFA